jgi:hypothetical protein
MTTDTNELFEKALAATASAGRMGKAMQKISESRAKKIASARKLVPNLIRRYPDPERRRYITAELRPRGDGDFDVVFKGGKHGEASILASMSDTARIVAHWNGYLQYNGIRPYAVGDMVAFTGPYSTGEKAAITRYGLVTHVTPTALTVTYQPRTMPGVKRTKTLKMNEVLWLAKAASPRQETT